MSGAPRSRRKGKALHEEHPMHDLIRFAEPLELGKYKLGGCVLKVKNMTAKTCRTKVVSPDLEEQIPLESPILFMVNKNALDGLAAYDLPERVPYPGWLIELYQDGDKQFMKVQFAEWAEENTEYDGELHATEDTMDIPLDDLVGRLTFRVLNPNYAENGDKLLDGDFIGLNYGMEGGFVLHLLIHLHHLNSMLGDLPHGAEPLTTLEIGWEIKKGAGAPYVAPFNPQTFVIDAIPRACDHDVLPMWHPPAESIEDTYPSPYPYA